MAEATLLGQNSGSSGSGGSVNLMDLYDSDKWEWHYITEADLSLPYTAWTKIVDVKEEGYLIGVAFYYGNSSNSWLRVNINDNCYLNNQGKCGIMWKDATYAIGGSGANASFYHVNFYYQNRFLPFLNKTVIPNDSTVNTAAQLLTTIVPLSFSSFSVLMHSSDSASSSGQFACVYVTKKS